MKTNKTVKLKKNNKFLKLIYYSTIILKIVCDKFNRLKFNMNLSQTSTQLKSLIYTINNKYKNFVNES